MLNDSQAAVRPAEAPAFAAAPRAVYQVTLPKDPSKGFIVVYEFVDPAHAAGAAAEQQAYLATGPGRVQTPQGTVSLIRQVGSTVVYYQWLPRRGAGSIGGRDRGRARRRSGSASRSRAEAGLGDRQGRIHGDPRTDLRRA